MWERLRLRLCPVDLSIADPDAVDLCARVLDGVEAHARVHLIPRFAGGGNLTLRHGDAYFANFLCARRADDAVLVEWQSPEADHPGIDLALLLASFWTPDQRHEQSRERRCLRLYHRTLRNSGVSVYTWDDLLTDYRAGLLYWLLMPLQDAADGSPPSYWLPKLHCRAPAAREWNCLDLVPGRE